MAGRLLAEGEAMGQKKAQQKIDLVENLSPELKLIPEAVRSLLINFKLARNAAKN